VQERLRYTPLGWTKRYEFSEADAACSLDVIDEWVDSVSAGGTKAHVNPRDLPWQALRTLLSQSLYGGRIDNPFDQVGLITIFVIIFSSFSAAVSPIVATPLLRYSAAAVHYLNGLMTLFILYSGYSIVS
jgi:hypothetical protein